MIIPEIPSTIINKIFLDQYKQVSGVFLIDKPVGLGSHDIVIQARKALRTKRVGHAGALDPFATGMLIILVGKFTKYSEALTNLDKSYKAGVLLGKKTTTQDPEGEALAEQAVKVEDLPSLKEIETKLQKKFMPGYLQYVPLFSSVKLDGEKLRVLARKAKSVKFVKPGLVELELPTKNGEFENFKLELPAKNVDLKVLDTLEIKQTEDKAVLTIEVSCSKGTYIRQLAEDIGIELNIPASLISLRRTRIGEFLDNNLISVADLKTLASEKGITSL